MFAKGDRLEYIGPPALFPWENVKSNPSYYRDHVIVELRKKLDFCGDQIGLVECVEPVHGTKCCGWEILFPHYWRKKS